MKGFERKCLSKQEISKDDKGVELNKLLDLIKDNDYYEDIVRLLDIDEIEDSFINIEGASTLVDTMQGIRKRYKKIDLVSKLKDIDLYDDDDKFSINFDDLSNNEYFKDLGKDRLITSPIYSAKNNFFRNMFQMDKYANSLIASGYSDLVKENLKLIKTKKDYKNKYRILHDLEDDSFYLRTITSTGRYYDYDNNIAVVIGLITLCREQRKTDYVYKLSSCDYNESYISMYFESSELKELGNIGFVKNLILISNDEIKRESLKFIGVCSICTNNNKEIYLQPDNIKFKILLIPHSQVPMNAISQLTKIENTKKIHDELYNDISKISNIKNPETIKYLIIDKVKKAKNSSIKVIKSNILSELNAHVSTVIELLELFNKINLIVSDDIPAKEYLRFIQYQALINRK